MITPSINEQYAFIFKPPYQDITLQWAVFTVRGVARMSDLITSGTDVWATYYKQYGIAYTQYASDVATDVLFYTLEVESGGSYVVPSSFVENILAYNFNHYAHSIITVDLDLLPTEESLEYLKMRLNETVRDVMGIIPDLYEYRSDSKVGLTEHEHLVIESQRDALRQDRPAWETMYHTLLLQAQQIEQERDALEKYIRNCLECSDCGLEVNVVNDPLVPVESNETLPETMDKAWNHPCCNGTISENYLFFMEYQAMLNNSANRFYFSEGLVGDYNVQRTRYHMS